MKVQFIPLRAGIKEPKMQPSKIVNNFKTSKVRQKSSTMVNSPSLIFPTQQYIQLQPYKDTDKIPQAQGWKEKSALDEVLLQSLRQLGSAFQGSWAPGSPAPMSPHPPPPSPTHEAKQSQKNNLCCSRNYFQEASLILKSLYSSAHP